MYLCACPRPGYVFLCLSQARGYGFPMSYVLVFLCSVS
jgi:hypothetical protein